VPAANRLPFGGPCATVVATASWRCAQPSPPPCHSVQARSFRAMKPRQVLYPTNPPSRARPRRHGLGPVRSRDTSVGKLQSRLSSKGHDQNVMTGTKSTPCHRIAQLRRFAILYDYCVRSCTTIERRPCIQENRHDDFVYHLQRISSCRCRCTLAINDIPPAMPSVADVVHRSYRLRHYVIARRDGEHKT
jgi:hypothetical protein